jgi:hypothetical protein
VTPLDLCSNWSLPWSLGRHRNTDNHREQHGEEDGRGPIKGVGEHELLPLQMTSLRRRCARRRGSGEKESAVLVALA